MKLPGDSPAGAGERPATVRAWVREVLALPPGTPVIVTEVPCQRPDCPPHETLIAVFAEEQAPRRFRLPHALADLTLDHIAGLARTEET